MPEPAPPAPTGQLPGHLADLLAYLDASPSPYHAVAAAAERLSTAGFVELDERDEWPTGPGRYLVRRGGSLVAWARVEQAPSAGLRLVGAHTDSPNLRIKPQPDTATAGYRQLGVEVYGGVLLNSWLDRDLGLSGRVSVRTDAGPVTRLVRVDRPLLRIPQLAIHLNRDVNDKGLVLNRQTHLAPIWGLGAAEPGGFARFLAGELGIGDSDVLAWDVMTHDLTPARLAASDELLVSGRIDNLVSCHAAVSALLDVADGSTPRVPLVCLFDHEEVGSVSAEGAASSLLPTIVERLVAQAGGDRSDLHRGLADSMCVSADGAHATHPNYAERHEPDHRIELNAGPVVKLNSDERYATSSPSHAAFVLACEQAGVPVQRFVNRSDLACGSTIGPVTAARLGIATVDAGVAQLAMHSARETAGADDPARFAAALSRFLAG